MNSNYIPIGPALNMPGEGSKYITFYGDIAKTIPEMLSNHYELISISQIMQRQLDVTGANNEVFDFWWKTRVITSTVIVYHPDKKIKIANDSDLAGNIHASADVKIQPYTRFNGGFALPLAEYDKFVGKEFSERECFRHSMQHDHTFVLNSTAGDFAIINKPDIKYGNLKSIEDVENSMANNPIWLALVGDAKLLKEYANLAYRFYERNKGKRKFKGDIHILDVNPKHLPNDPDYLMMFPLEFWTDEIIAIGMDYDVCRINYGAVESRKRLIEEKRIIGKPAQGYSPSDADPKRRKTLSSKINELRNRHDRFSAFLV